MKRSVSQESMNSGRRTPDGVTQRPAFLRSLSIEPDSPGPGTFDDDPAGKSPRDRRPLWGRRPSPRGAPAPAFAPRPWPYVLVTALVAGLLLIAHVGVSGELSSTKAEVARLTEALEGKRVPVVLQYSSFDFLKDKAKAIVEAHAKEAVQRWNV